MLIRMMSDLHLEMEVYNNGKRVLQDKYPFFNPVALDTDQDTILILAGDIGLIDSLYTVVEFIEDMCQRFKHVIYVPGNHEYYRHSFIAGIKTLRDALSHTSVHVMNDDVLKIDDVTFIGSTLWTDFENKNPLSIYSASTMMNDFRLIRTGHSQAPYLRKMTPYDAIAAHETSKAFIEDQLSYAKFVDESKVVVVSHHGPTFKSMHEMFIGSDVNGAYYSELGNMICHYSPAVWIHGHTHCSMDYVLGDTRIICNPRGYRPNYLNQEFDDAKVIEI